MDINATSPATALYPKIADTKQPGNQEPTGGKESVTPVTVVPPNASTLKPSEDTAKTASTGTQTKTKTWGEWFATPLTTIKNYFSGNKSDKAEDENKTITVSTVVPPKKTLGERMITAVKTVLSYMALPFKFLGKVAYHVIYRPLNTFVITPLKNAYNYFFNPEKYTAQQGSKNISESASSAKQDAQSDSEKDFIKLKDDAKLARSLAEHENRKAEIDKKKVKAANLIELENKFNKGLTLKGADGRPKAVRKAEETHQFRKDELEHARKGDVSDADFNKEVKKYEEKVEAYNKSMDAYNKAVAEAKKNKTALPEKPAALTVIRPERAPMAKCTVGSPVDQAARLSKEIRDNAAKADQLTALIAQLKADAEKKYPGQFFTVENEAKKVRLQKEMEEHKDQAHQTQEKLNSLTPNNPSAQQLRAEVTDHTQQADVRHRYLAIHSKECELRSVQEAKANYAEEIKDLQAHDRLQLNVRTNGPKEVKDENGKVIGVTYTFDKIIKNRPLPIPQQGLSWSKASLENQPYSHYEAIKDGNGKVTGWNTVAGKDNHWVVKKDKTLGQDGYDKCGVAVSPSTSHDEPGLPPELSQDEEEDQDIERLQNWVNTPYQPSQKSVDSSDTLLEELDKALVNAGFPPEHSIFSGGDVDPANPLGHLDETLIGDRKKPGNPVVDKNAESAPSTTDALELAKAEWEVERNELVKMITDLEKSKDQLLERLLHASNLVDEINRRDGVWV